MKRLRFGLSLALVACIFAATAASASAITIEPLHGHEATYPTSTVEMAFNQEKFGGWTCKETKMEVPGNRVAQDFITATPTFKGCAAKVGTSEIAMPMTTSCKTKGTQPWTLTLLSAESEGFFEGSLKLNCPLQLDVAGGACTITFAEQTAAPSETAVTWHDLEGINSTIKLNVSSLTYTAPETEACKTLYGSKFGTSGHINFHTVEAFDLNGFTAKA
jgi:hypothetical protein